MSGKFEKKKPRKKSHKLLWLFLMALVVALAILLFIALRPKDNTDLGPVGTAPVSDGTEGTTTQTDSQTVSQTDSQTVSQTDSQTVPQTTENTYPAGPVENIFPYSVDENIEIREVGKYVGYYMEDGSDEIVSDVTRITVTNNGETALQYAKLILVGPSGEAVFELTTLLPGQTMVVLEANRKPYTDGDAYGEVRVEALAYFQYEPSLHEDQLQIQPLDGGFNIKNISSQDITGKIMVYFKDYADGVYYGGITYYGTIEGGMKAGEIKQVMSQNFTADGTLVVFINIVE